MNKLRMAFIGALLAAALTIPIALRKESQLRAINRELRQQVEGLPVEPAEGADNERPGSDEAHGLLETGVPGSLRATPELLRLRGEVARARRDLAELEQIGTIYSLFTNACSLAYQEAFDSGLVPRTNQYPKEAWVYSGHASPQAALQSILWAMSQGDVNALLHCLGPNGFDWILKASWFPPPNATVAEIVENVKQSMGRITNFRVTGYGHSETYPMDRFHFILTPEIDPSKGSMAQVRPLSFEIIKVGDEWKCAQAGFLFIDELPGRSSSSSTSLRDEQGVNPNL